MKKRLSIWERRSLEELVGEDMKGARGSKKKGGSDVILFYLNIYVCNSSHQLKKLKKLLSSLQYV